MTYLPECFSDGGRLRVAWPTTLWQARRIVKQITGQAIIERKPDAVSAK
jgi:hypothetical protein